MKNKKSTRPKVPSGVYLAKCTGHYKQGRRFHKKRTSVLKFEILDEPYQGKIVFMAFTVRRNNEIALNSKYLETWYRVAQWHGHQWHEHEGHRILSPDIFLAKTFVIRTKTVCRRKSKDQRYSVVCEIHDMILNHSRHHTKEAL